MMFASPSDELGWMPPNNGMQPTAIRKSLNPRWSQRRLACGVRRRILPKAADNSVFVADAFFSCRVSSSLAYGCSLPRRWVPTSCCPLCIRVLDSLKLSRSRSVLPPQLRYIAPDATYRIHFLSYFQPHTATAPAE